MIEQIINWWNSLDNPDKVLICILAFLVTIFIIQICELTFGDILRNKRKTTTQKYREGLIKK